MARWVGHVVSHTHWDRAWYWTFEQSRARLVELVDGLLDLLERDPAYRHFVLDGQLALLDDYLAIRPEQRERLTDFVRAGRLSAGPLYVLPDLFLPSGESLLRNFEAGARAAARLEIPTLPLAYLPDPFGLPAQLPQILAGLGLRGVFFARGLGDEAEALGSDFRWQAAAGSEVLATVFLGGGYCNLARLGTAQQPGHADGKRPPAESANTALARAQGQLERTVAALTSDVRHGQLLLANGCDHLPPQPELPGLLDGLNRAQRRVRLRHSTLEDYHRAVRRAMRSGSFKPPSFAGELRGAKHAFILSGVLSARGDLKLAHRQAETLLLRWVEPSLALAQRSSDDALLEHAWRELLLCQPHDDICGCSIDAVHQDDHDRLRRVMQLGELLTERAAQSLGGSLRAAPENPTTGKQQSVLLNPLPWPQQALVELPAGWPGARDARETLATQRFRGERLALVSTPPLSARLLDEARGRGVTAPQDQVTAQTRGTKLTLQNAQLRVTVDPRGELTLQHRESGLRLPGLVWLEDEGDAGDTYDFSPPAKQRCLRGLGQSATLRFTARGPLRGAIELRSFLALPRELTSDRRDRSARLMRVPLELTISLDAACRWVALELQLDHRVDDHRLRFGLRLAGEARVRATTPFALTERSAKPTQATAWTQPAPSTHPCSGWSALEGRQGGLACITPGLHEVEVRQRRGGVELLTTLLRSVRWLSRADLATRPGEAGPCWPIEGARQRGPQTLRWALMPFAGRVATANIPAAAASFEAPPRTFALESEQSAQRASDTLVSPQQLRAGLLAFEHPAIDVTSVRAGLEGTLELRLVNLADEALELPLLGPWRRARRVDLAGRLGAPLRGGELSLAPGEIATVRLWPR